MRIVPDRSGGTLNHFSYHLRGQWYHHGIGSILGSGQGKTLTAGRLYTVPFYTGENLHIDGIRIYVLSGVANCHARIGIYANKQGKVAYPGNLVIGSTVLDCSTTGYKGYYWDWNVKPVTFRAGKLHWVAVIVDVDVVIDCIAGIQPWVMGFVGVESGFDPRPVNSLYNTMSYGALPSIFPEPLVFDSYLTDGGVGRSPVVYVRVFSKVPSGLGVSMGLSRNYQDVGKGYWVGGSTTYQPETEIDGIRFFDEAVNNPTAYLSTARSGCAAGNSSARGYVAGGSNFTPTYFLTAERLQFSTEVNTSLGNKLSVARTSVGVNSADRFYCLGGYNNVSPYYQTLIDGIRFDTEAGITTSAVLSVARSGVAGVNSSTYGYAMGGVDGTPTFYTEIDGIKFSDETSFNPSAVLSLGRGATGYNSSAKGYAAGGSISGNVPQTEIDGIQFSDDTAINPSAALAVARRAHAGCNSEWRGFVGGGYTTGYSAGIESFSFVDETQHNVTATLYLARYVTAAHQSGGWL